MASTALHAVRDPKESAHSQTNENIDRFLTTFERSAKRWEFVVYPALFAFIVLAVYGFFLIYSLTSDMHKIAGSMDPNMSAHLNSMSGDIHSLVQNIDTMTESVDAMAKDVKMMSVQMQAMESLPSISDNMQGMRVDLASMNHNMTHMNQTLGTMNANVYNMANSTNMMRYDMGKMTNAVGRPMSMISNMVPW